MWLFGLVVLSGLLSSIGCQSHSANDEPKRLEKPHVLVYLIDTLRRDHLSTYGYGRKTTPAIDLFAKSGVTFENAYSPSSWTKPAVGSLFTGLPPSAHGAVRREHKLRSDVPTMAEVFKNAGYETKAFVSNPNILPAFAFERGFDEFVDVESVKRAGSADKVHAEIDRHLREAPKKPQFLYVHTRDPHAPYTRHAALMRQLDPGYEKRVDELYQRVLAYDSEILFNDSFFGALIGRLRDLSILDDTIIVLLSDHGEEFLDHGGMLHAQTLYQEQLRVPLIMHVPGLANTGSRVEKPVRIADVLATLVEILKIEPRAPLGGLSFARLLEPNADARGYEPTLHFELNIGKHFITAILDGPNKLIQRRLPAARASDELFNIERDPQENRNILNDSPDAGRILQKKLDLIQAEEESGLYLEVTNAQGLSADNRLKGTITVVGGAVGRIQNSDFESTDVAVLSSPSTVKFSLALTNSENPIGQIPEIITDVDRIRLDVDLNTLSALKIDLKTQPVEAVLGAGDVVSLEGGEISVSGTDERMRIPARGLVRLIPREKPYIRIYTIQTPSPQEAHIDAGLEQRLRALGYVGED